MHRLRLFSYLVLPLLVAASWTVAERAGPTSASMPSHLRPHLFNHAPPALLEPLDNGSPGLFKGWNPDAERQLLADLEGANLQQRIVKVGVMDAAGLRLALVKLQAGSWRTGEFSVRLLQEEAHTVLRACFSDVLACDHTDLWSAVPYEGPDGVKWHWPVFSMSCWRKNYAAVANSDLSPGQSLQKMSLLRYDPLFLENAGDRALARGENVFDAPVPRLDGWRVPSLDFGTETTMALVRGSEHSSVVAITIDDGPHPVTTSLMLKILAEYQAKATFFVVGEAIMHYPQLLLDIVEAGHEVGNHCFTNRRLPSLPPSVAAAELGETSKLIEGLGRQRCRIMRPPGGDLDEKTLRLCTQMGLLPIFWSRNTGDWQPRPASDIARAALSNVKAGDIILLHQGRLESALALREIIAGLRQMGLQPGRVCDLFPNAPLVSGSPASVIAQLHTAGCLRDE